MATPSVVRYYVYGGAGSYTINTTGGDFLVILAFEQGWADRRLTGGSLDGVALGTDYYSTVVPWCGVFSGKIVTPSASAALVTTGHAWSRHSVFVISNGGDVIQGNGAYADADSSPQDVYMELSNVTNGNLILAHQGNGSPYMTDNNVASYGYTALYTEVGGDGRILNKIWTKTANTTPQPFYTRITYGTHAAVMAEIRHIVRGGNQVIWWS